MAADDCVIPLPNPPSEAALTASCPGCWESTGLFLEFTSAGHDANHFQCTACGHVWAEPKTESSPLV
jgi:ribosomal protein S27E